MNFAFLPVTFVVLINSPINWTSRIESDQIDSVQAFSSTFNHLLSRLYYNTHVLTPNGSSVLTYNRSPEELSDSQKAYYNNSIANNYPNATFLSTATRLYNCHSYAWYMQDDTYNNHWMDDPNIYISDLSYYRIYSNYQVGDIICYYNSNGAKIHSGRISQMLNGSANSVCGNSNLFLVTSKWGQCGLYSHRGDECPYTSYNSGASSNNLATSVRFYRISTSHSHSLNYISHTKNKHFTYCSCSMAYYENHDWESGYSQLKTDGPNYIPKYVCAKCGRTSTFPH